MPITSRAPPSSSQRHRHHNRDENRRRRTHHRIDSSGDPQALFEASNTQQRRTARRGSSAQPSTPRRKSAYETASSENEDDEIDEYGAGQGSPSKARPKIRESDREGQRREQRRRERDRERERERHRDRRDRDGYSFAPRQPHGRDRSIPPLSGGNAGTASRRRSATRSGGGSSGMLSSAALAQLDRMNQRRDFDDEGDYRRDSRRVSGRKLERETRGERGLLEEEREREKERRRRHDERRGRRKRREVEEREAAALAAGGAGAADASWEDGYDSPPHAADVTSRYRKERRVASGQALERGYHSEKDLLGDHDKNLRGGASSESEPEAAAKRKKKWRRILIGVGIVVLLLVIIIPVAVVTSNKSNNSSDSGDGGSSAPKNSNLQGISPSSIPQWAQGGYLDPFDWYTTLDFNVTFTNQTVGGLYVMGLNSTWDDNTQANPNVPKLNAEWQYGTMKMRGINLGGWLSIEPFISPSLFDGYSTSDNVVDEWTLSQTLGATNAKTTLEQHYATWVDEQTFADIAAAGFDHVRIPYSYWAVTTYSGDPYVPLVSWRYLLRGIEWARKYGLRINLDLHGLPGSQNGMNHSGHQGLIGWLNGTDGTLNGDRSIEIHNQLSQFFAQPRYKNIIALYGLANEPRMTFLDPTTVIDWSQRAITTIRDNNFENLIVVGDGFWALDSWKGVLSNNTKVVLDAHQYVIFNTGQIVFNHTAKVQYACAGWTQQAKQSMNTNTGFGPTIFGEWSQADTDCATYLNNVGVGSRWEGTLNLLDAPGDREVGASIDSVLSPTCPTDNSPRCDCTPANADPSTYSAAYKQWLLDFAEAQMDSFEYGWGWFYWTWKTESAVQWSYQAGLAAGIMPKNAANRSWNCDMSIPNYDGMGLPEYY